VVLLELPMRMCWLLFVVLSESGLCAADHCHCATVAVKARGNVSSPQQQLPCMLPQLSYCVT
jgi:hypothetical protein